MTKDNYEELKLTPTEALILEVLTARVRLGNRIWTFSNKLNKSLMTLEGRGLIGYKAAPVEGYSLAWFRDRGTALMLSGLYKDLLGSKKLARYQKNLRKKAKRIRSRKSL